MTVTIDGSVRTYYENSGQNDSQALTGITFDSTVVEYAATSGKYEMVTLSNGNILNTSDVKRGELPSTRDRSNRR